jgi:hypothetical protein
LDAVPDEKPAGTAPLSVFDLMLSGEVPPAPVDAPAHGFSVAGPAVEASRATVLEWLAIVLAIVVAPVGLVLAIIAVVRSSSARGYVSSMARASVVLGVVFSLIGAGGAVALTLVGAHAGSEAAIRASSDDLCAGLEERPGILDDAAFGWPALGGIPEYKAEVAAYVQWWQALEAAAPSQAKADVAAIVAAAESAANRMSVSRVVDHGRDRAEMEVAASASLLPGFVAEYCG